MNLHVSDNLENASKEQPVWDNWQDEVPLGHKGVASKGLLFVFGFLALFMLWAFLFPISSAVVATGKVISAGQNKLIQHPTGGVVRAINVADGDAVEKGQVIVVLDPGISQAELTRLTARRSLLTALKTRLESEQGISGFSGNTNNSSNELKGADGETVSISAIQDEATQRILDEQRREYEAGRKRLKAEQDAALFQIESLKNQEAGLKTRLAGERKLLDYTRLELSKVKPLVNDGVLPKARLWDLDKRRLEQETAIGNFSSEIAATKQRISEGKAKLAQLAEADQEKRSEELTKVFGELEEIKDQITAAQGAVTLTELKAPEAGTIVKLETNTVGGVVTPGGTVAEIVPRSAGMLAEFRVALPDINNVKVGQPARIVVTAFNRRTYEPIDGEVTYVSADSSIDKVTNESYFIARARMKPNETKNTGLGEIQVGMETEVYALEKPRVFMSYVLQPVFDSFNKAFRETK